MTIENHMEIPGARHPEKPEAPKKPKKAKKKKVIKS